MSSCSNGIWRATHRRLSGAKLRRTERAYKIASVEQPTIACYQVLFASLDARPTSSTYKNIRTPRLQARQIFLGSVQPAGLRLTFTAAGAGFYDLSQSGDRPGRPILLSVRPPIPGVPS
jgi:hypothetical protein